jgi:Xaa-Pro aminopeptidase
MERRNVLRGIGQLVAGGAALSAVPLGSSSGTARALTSASTPPTPGGKLLVNKPRAYAVLEELKLDGLIALNPINVYYLTNTWPLFTKFRGDLPAFATFARDPAEPSFLVTSWAQAFDFANGERELPELITWSFPADWSAYINASPEQMKIAPTPVKRVGWAMRDDQFLNAREKRWAEAQRAGGSSASPSPAWALARALKESGLDRGRIAIDDMRIAYLLREIGMEDITFVPGQQIFRKIRVVKSEPEIALQRIAGHNNGAAAMATIREIRVGMNYRDVEDIFRRELANRGSELVEFLVGVTTGMLPDGVVKPGRAFAIDAVSQYQQYHGDFGRTVIVGEPDAALRAREKAHRIGHDAVYEIVRPGVKLSTLRKTALEAEIKAGMPPEAVTCTPHGVGLEHGDNPGRLDIPFDMAEDIALEENMVITIDLPYIELGGHVGHHEDLIRITKTGFEPMNPLGDPLVRI